MHIAEGILPVEWALAWAVPAVAGAALGVARVKRRVEREPSFKPLLGLLGAAVFVISLMPIPVPVAGSVSHPAGTPLAAVLAGPLGAVVLAMVSLLLQALFFAHGGLTTLGANVVSEGLAGAFAGYVAWRLARRAGASLFAAGFAAGFLGDLAVYAATATELSFGLFALADVPARAPAIFLAFLPTQGPLAVLEGILTGGLLRALAEARPDVAAALGVRPGPTPGGGGPATRPVRALRARLGPRGRRLAVVAVSLTGLTLGWVVVWSIATSTGDWVGLDVGVVEKTAEAAGRGAAAPLLNTDVGNLLLLVFAGGALLGGFVLGALARGFLPRPRRGAAVLLTLLLAAAPVALLLMALASGVAGAGSLGASLRGLLDPLRSDSVAAGGGDLTLFLFMLAGLGPGLAAGWWLPRRDPQPPPSAPAFAQPRRLRLPHLHVHDFRAGDRSAWQAGGLGRLDARVKLVAALVLLGANLVVGSWFSLSLLVIVLAALVFGGRLRPRILLLRLAPALIVLVMLVALRGFTVAGPALLVLDLPYFAPVTLTAAGLASGLALGVVVLAGVSVVLLLGVTTPLPALLAALRWLRVPALLIEIGLLMYRYLFLLAEEAGRLRQAQRLRGPGVPWSRAVGSFSRLGAVLLIRSYDRSLRVHDAQRLRGGDGGFRASPPPLRGGDGELQAAARLRGGRGARKS